MLFINMEFEHVCFLKYLPAVGARRIDVEIVHMVDQVGFPEEPLAAMLAKAAEGFHVLLRLYVVLRADVTGVMAMEDGHATKLFSTDATAFRLFIMLLHDMVGHGLPMLELGLTNDTVPLVSVSQVNVFRQQQLGTDFDPTNGTLAAVQIEQMVIFVDDPLLETL